jgi:hypothetical protein
VVIAVLVHDVWDEPFEASLVTDVTAAVGVGAAMLLMAATDPARRGHGARDDPGTPSLRKRAAGRGRRDRAGRGAAPVQTLAHQSHALKERSHGRTTGHRRIPRRHRRA